MSGLTRYSPDMAAAGGVAVAINRPDPGGAMVLFADVEPALRDSVRLTWLLPVLQGTDDDPEVSFRSGALAMGLQQGLTGLALVDCAMEACSAGR